MKKRTHIKGDMGRGSCEDRVMDLVKEDGEKPYLEMKNIKWARIYCDSLLNQLKQSK